MRLPQRHKVTKKKFVSLCLCGEGFYCRGDGNMLTTKTQSHQGKEKFVPWCLGGEGGTAENAESTNPNE